ncbi:MAG: PAS domain S-box protein, partial [Gemmatimonadetes bacterium]|nr:PAS domain S-box protein [Gemmatimonadota bacterium]
MTPRRRTFIPLALVLVSLASLILVPFLVQRSVDELRREITHVAEPARALVTEIQLVLALEVAGARAFLLTGDSRYAVAHEAARVARTQAIARLLPLTRRLGPRPHGAAVELVDALRPADAGLDSLFAGRLSAAQYVERLSGQQASFERATASAVHLDREIGREVAERLELIRVRERFGTVLTALLVLLASVAALLVAHLGREYRLLAARRDAQARRQEALRGAAEALSAATSVPEAVRTIAERAVSLTRARGAYVERLEAPAPGGEMEVVAVAGDGVPPLGTRVPYPGSLSAEIIGSGEATVMMEVGAIGERMAPYLRETCRGCSGLVVPLTSEGSVLGALVLLRGAEQRRFTADEAASVRGLADLASAALRRVLLLEQIDRERRSRLALLQSTEEAICEVDAEGRFTFVNRAAARILGYAPEEMLGRDAHALVHATRPDGSPYPVQECPISRAALAGRSVRADTEMLWRKDGTLFPVEYSSSPIIADGEVRGAVVVFTDITERKRIEAERAALLAREREARGEAERRAREEEALRRATEAMTAAYTVEETLRRIAESALDATAADGAFVERLDETQRWLVVLAAAGELTPKVGTRLPYERSFGERVIERGEPLVIG